MNDISDSVGLGCRNRIRDVRIIQDLLNGFGRLLEEKLTIDGKMGPQTLAAIRTFQSLIVGLQQPDGRIDPQGPTMKCLCTPPQDGSPPPSVVTAVKTRAGETWPDSFVDPRVKCTAVTDEIIQALRPHFKGVKARVISGYLSDTDLVWKLNHHWEYLLWMTKHALGLDIDEQHKDRLSSLRDALEACAPEPASGYRTGTIGEPQDRSSPEQIKKRHRTLTRSKAEFARVVAQANLKKLSRRSAKTFDYAVAPLAPPGTSKHATGYALDIAGSNRHIQEICKSLGASLVFDEKSHVHVEFKNGVAHA